jgi:hypothetical protein
MDEMELAFEVGAEAERDLAAQQPHVCEPMTVQPSDDVKPAAGEDAVDRVPELRITDCTAHDSSLHIQINTRNAWLCMVALAPILAEYEPQPDTPPQPAPELAAAMGVLAEILGKFGTSSSGASAWVPRAVFDEWLKRAGLTS